MMQQPPEYTRLWKQASADYKLRDNLEVAGRLVWDGSECEEIEDLKYACWLISHEIEECIDYLEKTN